MRAVTHFAIGLASGVGLSAASGQTQPDQVMFTIGITGIAALLPDIDIQNSTINQMLFPKQFKAARGFLLYALATCMILGYFFIDTLPAWVPLLGFYFLGAAFFKHRSFTHSLFAWFYIGFISFLTIPPYLAAIMIGYASHLVTDACTKKGVPFFWPLHRKNYSLSQLGIVIRTNGIVDRVIGGLSLVVAGVGLMYYILS